MFSLIKKSAYKVCKKLNLFFYLFVLSCTSNFVSAESETIKVLSMHDPFAQTWSLHRDKVSERLGLDLDVTLMDYENSNRAIAVNATRRESLYDLVAIDIVWMGHYGRSEALYPLDFLESHGINPSSFIEIAWNAGRVNDRQLAVPIQPHPEILIYRKSVLDALNVEPPETTEDTIMLAKRISEEVPGMHGICWNGANGSALGQQMLHFAGAFGARIIDENGQFVIEYDAWKAAFEFAESLRRWSPPLIREMAWDMRIAHFQSGICGMSYAWGARTASLESVYSPIAGDIGYMPAPRGPSSPSKTPMGAWLLAIPANISEERIPMVTDALVKLISELSTDLLLELGVSAVPRIINGADHPFPVLELVNHLNTTQQLTTEMRPAVPEFQSLSEIIGVEAHSAIFGNNTSDAAIHRISHRISILGKQ